MHPCRTALVRPPESTGRRVPWVVVSPEEASVGRHHRHDDHQVRPRQRDADARLVLPRAASGGSVARRSPAHRPRPGATAEFPSVARLVIGETVRHPPVPRLPSPHLADQRRTGRVPRCAGRSGALPRSRSRPGVRRSFDVARAGPEDAADGPAMRACGAAAAHLLGADAAHLPPPEIEARLLRLHTARAGSRSSSRVGSSSSPAS